MSVLTKAADSAALPSSSKTEGRAQAIGGVGFDWLLIILGMVFLGGLYLDGWAHNHGRVDTSFFTIWHAFFYSGFGLIALALSSTMIINRLRGYRGQALLPKGYFLTALGLLIFAVGGIGDLIWHELFGIEKGLEALVSPTHLILGVGMGLIGTGPLRAAWHRPHPRGTWKTLGPAILSTMSMMSGFTFLLMYIHPILDFVPGPRLYSATGSVHQIAGFISLIVMAALLVGPVLLLMYRWVLPMGTLTIIWGINTILMVILDWKPSNVVAFTVAMFGASLLLDFIAQRLRPNHSRPGAFHLFAFLAPAILLSAYFATLTFTDGTQWSIHLLGGGIFMSSTAMWLLSHMIMPPPLPDFS